MLEVGHDHYLERSRASAPSSLQCRTAQWDRHRREGHRPWPSTHPPQSAEQIPDTGVSLPDAKILLHRLGEERRTAPNQQAKRQYRLRRQRSLRWQYQRRRERRIPRSGLDLVGRSEARLPLAMTGGGGTDEVHSRGESVGLPRSPHLSRPLGLDGDGRDSAFDVGLGRAGRALELAEEGALLVASSSSSSLSSAFAVAVRAGGSGLLRGVAAARSLRHRWGGRLSLSGHETERIVRRRDMRDGSVPVSVAEGQGRVEPEEIDAVPRAGGRRRRRRRRRGALTERIAVPGRRGGFQCGGTSNSAAAPPLVVRLEHGLDSAVDVTRPVGPDDHSQSSTDGTGVLLLQRHDGRPRLAPTPSLAYAGGRGRDGGGGAKGG
mmetsp:Transcript_22001/g.65118  ORF Transcript_22001/g.65118 Transcript_22001/m.65118 type:complete len:377 (-) Transcript_22001:399-1529(-)